ncbi:hypothetical protein B0H10DRAFT_2196008 [Mycena sp. CBHHK59/15]|nr:hypothetical protein B0H10DRAFT_2196008 [Mycena sp. CBHHK59/15]
MPLRHGRHLPPRVEDAAPPLARSGAHKGREGGGAKTAKSGHHGRRTTGERRGGARQGDIRATRRAFHHPARRIPLCTRHARRDSGQGNRERRAGTEEGVIREDGDGCGTEDGSMDAREGGWMWGVEERRGRAKGWAGRTEAGMQTLDTDRRTDGWGDGSGAGEQGRARWCEKGTQEEWREGRGHAAVIASGHIIGREQRVDMDGV